MNTMLIIVLIQIALCLLFRKELEELADRIAGGHHDED